MKHDQVRPLAAIQHGFTSWSEPFLIWPKQQTSAALHHRPAIAIYVGAPDRTRPSYHRPVCALRSAAAKVERHEEIVIAPMRYNERRFNRLPIRRQAGLRGMRI